MAEGGGATYRSFRTQVFDISLERELMRFASKRGPDFFEEYHESQKQMTIIAYALGETKYAPAFLFNTVMFDHLFTKEMRKHHVAFFVHQTKKQHKCDSGFHGSDELMEEDVSRFKNSLTSFTLKVKKTYQILIFIYKFFLVINLFFINI